VFIFFKSFPQSSSSFVLFFVLFGVEGGADFLRCCGPEWTQSAARFEPSDEAEYKVQVSALQQNPQH